MPHVDVIAKKDFKTENVNKIMHLKTDSLIQDTYYFKPGQVLDYHRHPTGDQFFFVHEGTGTYFSDEGSEECVELKPGVVVLAPKNIWHKIVARTDLVVSQATGQPAGMEKR